MRTLRMKNKLSILVNSFIKEAGVFQLPPDHQPAMKVPEGGSSCANCRFLTVKNGEEHCTSEYFIEWHGESKLPYPSSQFCSDWYIPK